MEVKHTLSGVLWDITGAYLVDNSCYIVMSRAEHVCGKFPGSHHVLLGCHHVICTKEDGSLAQQTLTELCKSNTVTNEPTNIEFILKCTLISNTALL